MMKTVWKYVLDFGGVISISVPKGANPLYVAVQEERVCLWICVLPEAEKEERSFFIAGTGQPIALKAKYIGSCTEGPYQWHVWEE